MRNLRKIEKPLALLSFLCLFPAGMSAQSIVKGVVTDPSGEPVIGATVKAAGSKLGVITDLDGKFSIDAASAAIYGAQAGNGVENHRHHNNYNYYFLT